MADKEEWYDNKEIFEMVSDLRESFQDLQVDLKETQQYIKKYNGLRKDYHQVLEHQKGIETRLQSLERLNIDNRVSDIEDEETKEQGAKLLVAKVKDNLGWIVAFLLGLLKIFQYWNGG